MLVIGVKGYYFGNKVDMIIVFWECFLDVWVMGNLDFVGVFRVLMFEDVFVWIEEFLICIGEYVNFIIFIGCDILFEVFFDNIQVFYLVVEKYNKGR